VAGGWWLVRARGAVGMRSLYGVACLEAVAAPFILNAHLFCAFCSLFHGRATPHARERIPTMLSVRTTADRSASSH
jgi:hypothetical protein